ncbi:MAG: hypothetical protein Q4D44_08340 [Eubacteriales bacterium]|nr:hypothetical protein [Eubacteriales bacterium]
MKKVISLILTLLLVVSSLLFSISVSAASKSAETDSVYAVSVDSPLWKEADSAEELRELAYVPESALCGKSTEELLKAVLEYPLIFDIYAYNDYETAINRLSVHCTALNLFLNRRDAKETINSFMQRNNAVESINAPECIKDTASATLEILNDYINSCSVTDSRATIYVQTPNGSNVQVFQYTELSQSEINRLNALARATYPQAQYVSTATQKYNCHSFAWYKSNTSNTYWMNDPSLYMSDGSYTSTSYISSASKVHYPSDKHSANVYDATGNSISNALVKSKWGAGPLMIHKVHYCPYSGGVTLWHRS